MPILISSLKRRYLTISFFLSFLIIIFTFSGSSWISKSFLPKIEDDEILVSVKLPDGSPFERTLEVSKIIENAGIETEKYYENKDNSIENTYINATGSSIRAYFNLYSPSDRKASATEIADILREKIGDIPDAEGLDVSKDIGRNPTDADLNFNITATKSEDLIPALNDFINNLRSYSATYDVRNSLNSSFTEIQISVRPNA